MSPVLFCSTQEYSCTKFSNPLLLGSEVLNLVLTTVWAYFGYLDPKVSKCYLLGTHF
jgi:hypothetical protein